MRIMHTATPRPLSASLDDTVYLVLDDFGELKSGALGDGCWA